MLRVLQIIEGLYAGGMESMLMNYFRNFKSDEIVYDFLIFSPKAHFDNEVEALGGRIFRLTPRRRNPLKNYYELWCFFKKHPEYQIVQIHQGVTYFAPHIFCNLAHVRHIISHTHGMNPNWIKRQGPFFGLVTQRLIKNLANEYIACSKSAAHQIFPSSISDCGGYILMNNAIDIKRFRYNETKRINKRKELGVDQFHVIGHVGNFTYPKNHPFLIKVFKEVVKRDDSAMLLLVGEGIGKQNIIDLVDELGLKEKVKFLGNRSDVDELLLVFDLFFFPSYYEGLPVSLIAAQATGIHCVVSDTITREVEVTPNVKYLSLNEKIDTWVDSLLDFNYLRYDEGQRITAAGYNIECEVEKITQFYKSLDNKS